MRRYLTSAVMGLLAMTAVNAASVFTGLSLPVGVFTMAVSGTLGIPGVAGMLLINYMII